MMVASNFDGRPLSVEALLYITTQMNVDCVELATISDTVPGYVWCAGLVLKWVVLNMLEVADLWILK